MRERTPRLERLQRAGVLARRLLGAVVLGTATIFLLKAQADQHWSHAPVIEMVADHDQAGASGPPR